MSSATTSSSARVFWTKRRLRRASVSVLLAFGLTAVLCIFLRPENSSAAFRGDFPAFYSAGRLVLEGRGFELYNQSLHREVQNAAWPDLEGRYLAYAYPPYVAAFFAPLSVLPPHIAKGIWSLLMLGCLLSAMGLLVSVTEGLDTYPEALAFAITFAPIASGVIAGQNISLSLFLFVGAIWALKQECESMAGLLLGLWLFKPHYGLLAIFFVSLMGRNRVILPAALIGVLMGLIAVAVSGLDWLYYWTNSVSGFSKQDAAVNGYQMISPVGFAEALARACSFNVDLSLAVAHTFSIAMLAMVSFYFWRARRSKNISWDLLYLIGPAILVISPHSLYYDLGLAFVPLLVALGMVCDRSITTLMAVNVFSIICVAYKESFPAQPLVLVTLGTFVYIAFKWKFLSCQRSSHAFDNTGAANVER